MACTKPQQDATMDGVAAWLVAEHLLDAQDTTDKRQREMDDVIRNAGGCTFIMPARPVFNVIDGVSDLQADWFEKVAATDCDTEEGLIRHEIVCRGIDFHKHAKSVNAAMNKWVASSREHAARAERLTEELEECKATLATHYAGTGVAGRLLGYIKRMIWR